VDVESEEYKIYIKKLKAGFNNPMSDYNFKGGIFSAYI